MRASRSSLRPAALLSGLLLVLGLLVTGSPAAAEPSVGPSVGPSGWTPRGEDYAATAVEKNLSIPMSDGLALLADATRPVDASGAVVTEPLPVVVTITAYSKSVIGSPTGATLGGADPAYLVKRGYVQLTVDARGTGSSPGTWQVFGEREQLDAKEIVEWAADQPWSNGSVAMTGPSYMGISQLFAAGQQPRGLKAIFPQVPSAEVYRDVVASGGQLDVGFMPLWLGLVNLTGYVPGPPEQALQTFLEHLTGNGASTLQLLLSAATGGENAYDGPYYEERSTLTRAVPTIDVPTFLIGGHYDLFQRGTPLVFQGLQERGVPVKMILGPWDHLQGSSGEGVPDAGYGTLGELQLRWFDHHVKGLPDPALDSDIPDFTYYELGSQTWQQRDAYLDEQQATSFRLSGTSAPLFGGGVLTQETVVPGESVILPLPVAGLCTRSTSQWTAGVLGLLGQDNPCDANNALNDTTGVVYETAPLSAPLDVLGPINARLYASSTTGDGMLSVHVSRVAPDGRVERLTGGWQVISLAQLDEQRSETIDGKTVQPWHPFTAESRTPLAPGEVAPIDVEVFPTGAEIAAGDRLRISVQAFDVPHLAPNVSQLVGSLGIITIHSSDQYPSELTLPTLNGSGAANAAAETAVLDSVRDRLTALDGDEAPGTPAVAPPAAPPATNLAGVLARLLAFLI